MPDRKVHQLSGVGFAAHLLQCQRLHTARIAIRSPTFVHVVRGVKAIVDAKGRRIAAAGQLGVLPCGVYDLINEPGEGGVYEAKSLSVDLERVAPGPLARRYQGGEATAFVVSSPSEDFLAAFARARAAVLQADTVPLDIARHRALEVLEWLHLSGYQLPDPQPRTAQDLVRDLIMTRPDAPWTAPAIAQELCVSTQTLRRRLAEQGQSFSSILFDVRMSCALSLLQSTPMQIIQVALACGYDSPSRFSSRFRQRFGFTPSAVRNSAHCSATSQ